MFYNLRNITRLAYITMVLARHDALFMLRELGVAPVLANGAKILSLGANKNKRPGERIADALSKLGPAFIKLGQALSTRSDVFGEYITRDLAVLQDKMPPFSGELARVSIENELGGKIEDFFSEFDDEAIAAASISQVHFAKDLEGKELAVKVLRPGIEKEFAQDVELLMWLAFKAEKKLPKRLKPVEVVLQFAESARIEMDLRLEAAAASELAENFAGDDSLVLPEVQWQKTSRRVLTTSRVSGINISHRDALVKGKRDIDAILSKAAAIVFNMVLRDGFFHADLHPGNMFIDKKSNIILVDFGIMGRLDKKTRQYLAAMLYGFLKRDYMLVAKVHFDAGYVPQDQSLELFAQACRSIGEPILGQPQNEISVARLLGQLIKISDDFKMELQPQLLLLQKTMMLTEGVGRKLNPNVNMWQLAEPLIEEWAIENLGPKAKLEQAFEDIKYFASKARGFAETLDTLSQMVTKDGLKLHPSTIAALKRKKKSTKKLELTVYLLVSATMAALIIFLISQMGIFHG